MSERSDAHKKTDDLIQDCIPEGLVSVVVVSGARSILYSVKKDYGIDYEKICHSPQDFVKSLKSMLSTGGDLTASRIVMKLRDRFGIEVPDDVVEAIQRAHRIHERSSP